MGFVFKVNWNLKLFYWSYFLDVNCQGSLQDEASLVEAIKQVDVVICAISSNLVLDQKLLIPAIKQAGCIKVFISSFRSFLNMNLFFSTSKENCEMFLYSQCTWLYVGNQKNKTKNTQVLYGFVRGDNIYKIYLFGVTISHNLNKY